MYILKKHGENKICANKIENRITFEIKTRYYLELLTPETMKLLGSTEDNKTKNKNCEYIPHLKSITKVLKITKNTTKVLLVHCNIGNNYYKQDSRVLYTFVPNKSFGSLLEISPKSYTFLKIFNSEFGKIEVWFTDQRSQPLEIENKLNLTLIMK